MLDVQTALRAEIRSYLHGATPRGIAREAKETIGKILAAPPGKDSFVPFVPRPPSPFIFEAIVKDIHVLPTSVIDPMVLHYKQRAEVAAFVEDMRSEAFASLAPERKARMYEKFAALNGHALELAEDAIAALDADLRDDQ